MSKPILAPLVLSLALAACMPVVVVPDESDDTCGASAFQNLVGQPRAVLDGIPFNTQVRIIPEGGVVTMDFSPGRLNFQLDGVERIQRVYCG